MYSHDLSLVVNGHLEHFQLHWKAAQALSVKNQQQNKQQEKNMTLKKGKKCFFLLIFLPKVVQFFLPQNSWDSRFRKKGFLQQLCHWIKFLIVLHQPYESTTTLWLTGNIDLYLLPSIMYRESYKTKVVIRENHSCFVHKSLIGSNNRNTFVMS